MIFNLNGDDYFCSVLEIQVSGFPAHINHSTVILANHSEFIA